MYRDPLRPMLLRGVVATLLLPVVIASALGMRSLLDSLGDPDGALLCGRLGLFAAVLWVAALVGTVAVTAVAVVGTQRPHRPRRRRRRVLGLPPAERRPPVGPRRDVTDSGFPAAVKDPP